LGFTGYYHYFIKGYSQIARPLLEPTRKGTPWHWDDPQQEAFKTLKKKICEKPILANPDPKKMFYLQTDASTSGPVQYCLKKQMIPKRGGPSLTSPAPTHWQKPTMTYMRKSS
jgi:hypothetical protein